jgi:hypothetical protein
MPNAEFTYEVRKLPEEPVGIEDYDVRTRDGEAVGTVGALLERSGERLVVVESGVPPLAHARRVVEWNEVDRVDHEALAVWLTVDAPEFESVAPQLDPDRAVEQGQGQAEAKRVTTPPDDLIPSAQTGAIAGPVDRTTWAKAFAAFALFAFSILVATVVVTFTDDAVWMLLFLVSAAIGLVAATLGYRTYRNPYEARGARKR